MKNIKKIIAALLVVTTVNSPAVFAAETSKVNASNNTKENVVVNELTSKPVSMRGVSASSAYLTDGDTWIRVVIEGKIYGLKVTSYENYIGDGYNNDTFAVWILQILLNHYGAGLKVDSKFGPQTKAAIWRFQNSHRGLSKDYICGPDTWRELARNF